MPTNPRRTRRSEFFRAGGASGASAQQMEQYARNLGFPSFTAMAAVVDLGSRLSSGEKITNAHVDELAGYYPTVGRAKIAEYAHAINSYGSPDGRVDALIGLVWDPSESGLASGRELIGNFTTHSYASAIDAKREASAQADAPAQRAARNREDPDSVRAALERTVAKAMGPSREQVLNTLEPKHRRALFADQLDANADARIRASRDPNSTLHDALSAAWDSHSLTEEAHEELDGADIEETIGLDINLSFPSNFAFQR